jgi:lipid-A-disaccharide synthase
MNRTAAYDSAPLRIGLVAGEASGDLLGAALIAALRERQPELQFVGLTGSKMRAAGCDSLATVDELAVMGLVEPIRHLPRLLRLRQRLRREFLRRKIDIFVGIDSPAFNLGLARQLRQRAITTVQYVSPQVWAWRPGRVPKIAAAVDAVLCLLPFEPAAYQGHAVNAQFVGHPMADQIPLQSQREAARRALQIPADATVVAVLPGSRPGEIERLGVDFAQAVRLLADRYARPLWCISPMVSDSLAAKFAEQVAACGAQIRIVGPDADSVLAAADVALVASGTASLQTMLHGVPMVVAYRLAAVTAWLVRDLGLVKLKYFSLPNLLADEPLVAEFFQEAVTPQALAEALHTALTDQAKRQLLQRRFANLHATLRQGGATKAADVVLASWQSRRNSVHVR